MVECGKLGRDRSSLRDGDRLKISTVTVAPLGSDRLTEIVALDRRCLGGLWSEDGYRRELDSDCSDLLGLFAGNTSCTPTKLLGMGCQWAILEEAHITLLAIDPNYRRQGLGELLFYTLLVFARQRGLERATLEVRESNTAALSLYQKFGFKEAGRRRRYYPDTDEDALILWRSGLHYPEFQDILNEWEQRIRLSLHPTFQLQT